MRDTNTAALLLRLPAGLKQWLRLRAHENDRTMTAEVNAILKATQQSAPQAERGENG
ncbi:MAG: Arc family DNA-binding protein [Rhodobacteraceae bacterium]|nr:Arc family DNA-binding protein [Paracoccaceae bacterium]